MCGYLYFWYDGKNLGFPIAWTVVSCLATSAISYLAMPLLYTWGGSLALPFCTSFVICCLGFFCGLSAGIITKLEERRGLVKVSSSDIDSPSPRTSPRGLDWKL
jgi:hypothetical protein